MADVLLHEYVQELREYVHTQKYSDAFALGQHILHYYPKHLETYVALAQACLDTNDLAGATDLLRRVLSADPENVIALAGMALIHEAQEKYDEALWYLERAYEIQPTNDELRRELVRVRELYYGTNSERLELTPGALARVYARQGQYASAVNEFRRLLRTETKRFDARVALAETLYRAGRADEAAQLAQSIMADAPFALKPNLILGVLWSENSVPEGQQFLQRAHAVDPEYRVAREFMGMQFANAQPPRLPSRDAQVAPSDLDNQYIGLAHGEPTPKDEEQVARQAALLRNIERAAEEIEEEQPLPENPNAEADVSALAFAAAAAQIIPEVAAKQQTVEETVAAQPTAQPQAQAQPIPQPGAEPQVDSTLAEIEAAEKAHAETPAPVPPPPTTQTETTPLQLSQRLSRPKIDSIPADAIAAAAAALATSIAVDKMSQPAPARRTHPSLPKVRPVIRGASDKLPAWLRLSATPSQASASFEVAPTTTAEKIEPLATTKPDDRPDWLVQAQAASQETTPAPTDANLPAWLGTSDAVTAPPKAEIVAPTVAETVLPEERALPATPDVELPEWLRDAPRETPRDTTTTATAQNIVTENVAPEPQPQTNEAEAVPDSFQSSNTTATPAPEATVQEQPVAPEPAPEPVQEKPLDALTLIANARERRDNGDLKGALDLYERAMHRRPNHLDEIILDLQNIVAMPNVPSTANRMLGEAFAMAGRFKESLEQYRIAMGK